MHKSLVPLLTLTVLWSLAAAAYAAPGDVRRTIDSPCSYPAGIAADGSYLYVADWRAAKIYWVHVADGKVAKTFDAPTLKPHGLTFGEGRVFVSDDHSGWVYALNPTTGMVEKSFEAPGPQAVGLAHTEQLLFVLERQSRKIYLVSPVDGTIINYFDTPTNTSTCLTFDGRYLWVADRIKDELYRLDPRDGTVLGILDAPGPHAAGLAWLDGHLWNADFQTRKLYEIGIDDEPPYRLSDPREARVECVWGLYNYGPGDVRDLMVYLALPPILPNQAFLSDIRFSEPPVKILVDRWGQRCAQYKVFNVPGGTRQLLSYSVDARISAIRYLIDPAKTGTLADIPDEIRKSYTVEGSRYRVGSPYIQQKVKEIVGDEKNCYWIARKIYNHLLKTLSYEMVGGWDVPEVVLKRGTGSCSEYTFAFIALCRAAGLPARYQGSVAVRGDEASIDEPHHRWAEVYLPNHGWVPVDASRGDKDAPADQARGFGELSNDFLITTQGGGDSEYLAWNYNHHASYSATGYCKIEQQDVAFWEPLKPADKETEEEEEEEEEN